MRLLTSNAKLARDVPGWRILGLQLLPGNAAGVGELCPERGQCFKVCLAWAGRGIFASVRKARRDRTRLLFRDPVGFADLLAREIAAEFKLAEAGKAKLAIRLNVYSDIDWQDHPAVYRVLVRYVRLGVVFYDYTKRTGKPDAGIYGSVPRVCYSWSERSSKVPAWAQWVAIVSETGRLPLHVAGWRPSRSKLGWIMSDGDRDDLFFLRPPGIQELAPKGKGRKEGSAPGFIMRSSS